MRLKEIGFDVIHLACLPDEGSKPNEKEIKSFFWVFASEFITLHNLKCSNILLFPDEFPTDSFSNISSFGFFTTRKLIKSIFGPKDIFAVISFPVGEL